MDDFADRLAVRVQGFKQQTMEGIHGSLLTIGEALSHTGTVFMRERFPEVCQTILKYKSNPNRLIRRTVIMLLPRLAAYFPDQFVQNYLPLCMDYLLDTLKKLTDANLLNFGSHALIAMGEIATVRVGRADLLWCDSLTASSRPLAPTSTRTSRRSSRRSNPSS